MIIREVISTRAFESWTMGFVEASAGDLDAMTGLHEAPLDRVSLVDVQPGRARKLLEAFAKGRWRTRLTETGVRAA